MQEPVLFIGVDVSKAELVISPATAQRPPRAIANDAKSITDWLREVPGNALVAMESTGRYHALLAHLAKQAGLNVYVLNARDVFFYAKALGTRAKTDGVDCVVIARYLAEHHAHLHPWQPRTSLQQRLQDLLTRRARVATHRSALNLIMTGVDARDIDASALQSAFDEFLRAMDDKVQQLMPVTNNWPKAANDCARSPESVPRPRHCWASCSLALTLPTLMRWSPTVALIPDPMIRAPSTGGVD
jgi:transposase